MSLQFDILNELAWNKSRKRKLAKSAQKLFHANVLSPSHGEGFVTILVLRAEFAFCLLQFLFIAFS